MKKIISILLSLLFVLTLASCAEDAKENPDEGTTAEITEGTTLEGGIWALAKYTEDTVLGEGATKITLSVITEEKTVKFTINTDKTVLGDVLTENGLVEGEEGPYGLYIKKVNGISAVYETDGAYWSVSIDGETAVTGIDAIDVTDGGKYELTYTKA